MPNKAQLNKQISIHFTLLASINELFDIYTKWCFLITSGILRVRIGVLIHQGVVFCCLTDAFAHESSNTFNITFNVLLSPRPLLSINSWIVIQNKVPQGQSSTSFIQDWVTYRNGFGDLKFESNYWIGNEVIFELVTNWTIQAESGG